MKLAVAFGVLAVVAGLASACGGKVQTDRDAGKGGSGEGGDDPGGDGGAASCDAIECSSSGTACSCETKCEGPDLRAECDADAGGEVVCTCEYDGAYLGLCSSFGGEICGLPNGCCYAYLP